MQKQCSTCRVEKDIEEFGKVASYKDGRKYRCKICEAEANRNSRQKLHDQYYANQEKARRTLEGLFRSRVQSAKTRASKKGFEFNITSADMVDMYRAQNGKCAITNLDMPIMIGDRFSVGLFSPSIDRIDNALGYTLDNVQLVCTEVNRMKYTHSIEQLLFWTATLSTALKDNQQPSF